MSAFGKVVDVLVATPPKVTGITIEETGRGRTLCFDQLFGRLFRDDPACLRDICDRFCERYNDSCEKLDEDPKFENYDVTNYNELYACIGIIPSTVGDNWGWTNDQDWRVHLEFEYETITGGPLVQKFGEDVFCFGPKQHCEPMECYREV